MMNNAKKKMDKENKKRVAIALWRANASLKDIRSHTKMKNQLKESFRFSNLQEFKQELWIEKMEDIKYLHNLVGSMTCVLQDVLERDGGCTKY